MAFIIQNNSNRIHIINCASDVEQILKMLMKGKTVYKSVTMLYHTNYSNKKSKNKGNDDFYIFVKNNFKFIVKLYLNKTILY